MRTLTLFLSCFVYLSVCSKSPMFREIGFKKELHEDLKYCDSTNKKDSNNCDDFINPQDMLNYVHGTKSKSSGYKNCQASSISTGCEHCNFYMQRFVGLFVRATGLQDYILGRNSKKMVNLNLVIKQDSLKVLQMFVETGKVDLSAVNEALTEILTMKDFSSEEENNSGSFSENGDVIKSIVEYVKMFIIVGSEYFRDYPQHFIATCVVFVFGITYWQMIKTRSIMLHLSMLGFIIFASGFAWTWFRMYKIADTKRFTSKFLEDGDIPIYCRPDKMSWYHYIYYYSYRQDCEEYFRRQMIDPIVEISPTVVLAETLTGFVFYPAKQFGAAFGNFIRGITDSVPWPFGIILVPIILIMVTILSFLLLTVLFGKDIKFNIFPFFSLRIGSSSHSVPSIKDDTSRENRKLIEEINSTPSNVGDDNVNLTSASSSCKSEVTSKRGRAEMAKILKRFEDIRNEMLSDSSENSDVVQVDESSSRSDVPKVIVNVNLPGCKSCKPSSPEADKCSAETGENSKVVLKLKESEEVKNEDTEA